MQPAHSWCGFVLHQLQKSALSHQIPPHLSLGSSEFMEDDFMEHPLSGTLSPHLIQTLKYWISDLGIWQPLGKESSAQHLGSTVFLASELWQPVGL
jgi:hypothetical protein